MANVGEQEEYEGNEEEIDTENIGSLLEEFKVSVEVKQFKNLAKLGVEISRWLVSLAEREPDYRAVRCIELLCDKIRDKSLLASIYDDILEFVHIKDLVCLNRLVRVVKSSKELVELTANLDELACILRKAIYLLKSQNSHTELVTSKPITGESIHRVIGIGFPKYMIEFSTNLQPSELELNSETIIFSSVFLNSSLFKEFKSFILEENLPIDRFSVLIAIWIVAKEADHSSLEQIIGQLVEQIYHQETNACNEEELLQLTQVGSFWLSHHKHYKASLRRTASMSALIDDDEDEDDNDDDDDADDDIKQQGEVFGDFQHNNSSDQNNRFAAMHSGELKAKLRKIIDSELLTKIQCKICDYKTNEPLESLTSGLYCSNCNEGPALYCSLSFRKLELVELIALARVKHIQRATVLSSAEWTRAMVLARSRRAKRMGQRRLETARRISERLDISDKFERLTVVRGEESGSDDSQESSLVVDEDESDNKAGPMGAFEIVASLMLNRLDGKVKFMDQTSESFKMFQSNLDKRLIICEADVLVLDYKPFKSEDEKQFKSSYQLKLVASSALFSNGSLWSCSERSSRAGLLLGCGRLFCSLELVKLGLGSMESFKCPKCGCYYLSKVKTLSEVC